MESRRDASLGPGPKRRAESCVAPGLHSDFSRARYSRTRVQRACGGAAKALAHARPLPWTGVERFGDRTLARGGAHHGKAPPRCTDGRTGDPAALALVRES